MPRYRPISNRKAAKRSGVTHSHISRVLRGLKDCKLSTAMRIADAKGWSMNRLVDEIAAASLIERKKQEERELQELRSGYEA